MLLVIMFALFYVTSTPPFLHQTDSPALTSGRTSSSLSAKHLKSQFSCEVWKCKFLWVKLKSEVERSLEIIKPKVLVLQLEKPRLIARIWLAQGHNRVVVQPGLDLRSPTFYSCLLPSPWTMILHNECHLLKSILASNACFHYDSFVK